MVPVIVEPAHQVLLCLRNLEKVPVFAGLCMSRVRSFIEVIVAWFISAVSAPMGVFIPAVVVAVAVVVVIGVVAIIVVAVGAVVPPFPLTGVAVKVWLFLIA